MRQITIREVARKAGVSIATVSRVLNNVPRGVGTALRKRVLSAARALDFRPNALARSLHQRRTQTLGLLITDIANPFNAEVTRGIEGVSRRHGYSLFICNTDWDPTTMAHYIEVLREKRVDGIIIVGGGTPGRRQFQALHDRRIPAVLIGRHHVPLPSVRVDHVKGGWEAASHLIGLGHRQIAILPGPVASISIQDRMKGYRRALAEHGIPLPRGWVLPGDLRPGNALHLAERLLRGRQRPTAVLAANDQMAIAVMRAAFRFGLRVPEDISVVGFDDIELASYVIPTLTTMRLPIRQMGVTAAEIVIRLLIGSPGEEGVCFIPELIIRESTAPPPTLGMS